MPVFLLSIILLVSWEFVARTLNRLYIFPSPTAIVVKILQFKNELFLVHLPATAEILLIGLFVASIIGIILAILMNTFQWLERAIYPLLVISQTIPITALAPIFVLWFGYTIWSKVLVVILITFFPIALNFFDGLKSTKRELEELLQTYGASKWQLLSKLQFPSALPQLFTALKIAIPLSIIGAAIGEWLSGQVGLGYFSKRMMSQMDGAGVFAPIVILSAMAVFAVSLIRLVEKKIMKWGKEI